MREQIAERIYDLHWRDGSSWTFEQAKQQRFMKTEIRRSYEEADEYVSLLIEEMKKELLTEKEIDIEARSRPRETWLEYGKDIAQAQLQKIIKAFSS
jgi:hypothetical protein